MQFSFSRSSLVHCQLPITMLHSNRISHLVPWCWVQDDSCSSPIHLAQQAALHKSGSCTTVTPACTAYRLHTLVYRSADIITISPPWKYTCRIAVVAGAQVQLLTIAGPGSLASSSSSSGGRWTSPGCASALGWYMPPPTCSARFRHTQHAGGCGARHFRKVFNLSQLVALVRDVVFHVFLQTDRSYSSRLVMGRV